MISKIIDAAKEFSQEKIGGYAEGTLWAHTLLVLKIADRLVKQSKGCNKEALMVGCYLHDIGRTKDPENHPLVGKEMAEHFFDEHPDTSDKFKRIVYDIILNHGTGKKPQTKEGIIVSSADKMSVFDNANIIAMVFQASKKVNSLSELSTYIIKKFEKKYNGIPLELGKQIIVKKYKESKLLFSSFVK